LKRGHAPTSEEKRLQRSVDPNLWIVNPPKVEVINNIWQSALTFLRHITHQRALKCLNSPSKRLIKSPLSLIALKSSKIENLPLAIARDKD